jgi:hypothetical protein
MFEETRTAAPPIIRRRATSICSPGIRQLVAGDGGDHANVAGVLRGGGLVLAEVVHVADKADLLDAADPHAPELQRRPDGQPRDRLGEVGLEVHLVASEQAGAEHDHDDDDQNGDDDDKPILK